MEEPSSSINESDVAISIDNNMDEIEVKIEDVENQQDEQKAAQTEKSEVITRLSRNKNTKKKKKKSIKSQYDTTGTETYKEGEIIAVRCEEKPHYFWLASVDTDATSESKEIEITWFESTDGVTFTEGGEDEIIPSVIICNTKLIENDDDTYTLPHSELKTIKDIILQEMKEEKSEDDDAAMLSEESEIDGGKDEEIVEDEDEKEKKKKRRSRSNSKTSTPKKKSGKKKKSETETTTSTTPKKGRKRKNEDDGSSEAPPAKKRRTSKKDTKSTKKNSIKPMKDDPTWESDATEIVNTDDSFVASKELIRAVLTQNVELVKKIFEDSQHVYHLNLDRSVNIKMSALHYAIQQNNLEIIKLFSEEANSKTKRCSPPSVQLPDMDTGSSSCSYARRMRKVSISRGGKEGNNAFKLDLDGDNTYPSYDRSFVSDPRLKSTIIKTENINKETIQLLITSFPMFSEISAQWIGAACQRGNRTLASHLMKTVVGDGFGFNDLHRLCLSNDNEDLPTIRAVSVTKKCNMNNLKITPLHIAAINPNPKYLKKLIAESPLSYNVVDDHARKIIHYAAACSGPEPLKFLLGKDKVNYKDIDRSGNTPLMIAASCGRYENVKLLLDHDEEMKAAEEAKKAVVEPEQKEDEMEVEEEKPLVKKRRSTKKPIVAVPYIDQTDNVRGKSSYGKSWTALHYACWSGYPEVVKLLLERGANPNIATYSTKLTAMHVACQSGNLDCVKLLVEHNVDIEPKDNKKRTPLIHAIIDGHLKVVSYLLSVGADFESCDSSQNSALHYAAGYGWIEILKYLVHVGASPNKFNDWKTTPLGISLLKGHVHCANYLLDVKGVDVNIKDDEGKNLISQLLSNGVLNPTTVKQIKYLVESKGANITDTDVHGYTPLHHLAENCPATPVKNSLSFPILLFPTLLQTLRDGGVNVDQPSKKANETKKIAIDDMELDLMWNDDILESYDDFPDYSDSEDESSTLNTVNSFYPTQVEDPIPYYIDVAKFFLSFKTYKNTKIDAIALPIKDANGVIEEPARSAVQIAISAGSWELATFLIEQGADILSDADNENNVLFDVINSLLKTQASYDLFKKLTKHKDFHYLLNTGVNVGGLSPFMYILSKYKRFDLPKLPSSYDRSISHLEPELRKNCEAFLSNLILEVVKSVLYNTKLDVKFVVQKKKRFRNVEDNKQTDDDDDVKDPDDIGGFPSGSTVLSNKGDDIPIEELARYDYLLTYQLKSGTTYTNARIDLINSGVRRKLIKYTLQANDKTIVLTASPETSIYAKDKGWSSHTPSSTKHKKIEVGDKVVVVDKVIKEAHINMNIDTADIKSIEEVVSDTKTYQITSLQGGNDSNYLVNRVLVQLPRSSHNKAPKRSGISGSSSSKSVVESIYETCGLSNIYHFLSKIENDALRNELINLLIPLSTPNLIDGQNINGKTPLFSAIKYDRIDYAQILLDKGADITKPNKMMKTPLMFACRKNWSGIVQFLSTSVKDDTPLDTTNAQGSALHHAFASSHSAKILEFLLSKKANPNTCDDNGDTPLHIACAKRNIGLVEILLKYKANVNAKNYKHLTPLHTAITNASQTISASFSLEEILIDAGADVNSQDHRGRTPLHCAFNKLDSKAEVKTDPIDVVSGLCKSKNIKLDIPDRRGRTPLHYAAINGSTICSVYLIKAKANLEAEDKDHNTPLAKALLLGHMDHASFLIQQGADCTKKINIQYYTVHSDTDKLGNYVSYINQKNLHKKTMFRRVVDNTWQGVAHLMLDSNINISSAIADALEAGKFNLILSLLSKASDEQLSSKVNDEDQNLLHVLAKHSADESIDDEMIASKLIKLGVDVKAFDSKGMQAIHYAADNLNINLISYLLRNGASATEVDKHSSSPLSHALTGKPNVVVATTKQKSTTRGRRTNSSMNKNTTSTTTTAKLDENQRRSQVVELLLESGASINDNVCTADKDLVPLVFYVIEKGLQQLFDDVLTKPSNKLDLNIRGPNGNTPLMHAIKHKNLYIVSKLLKLGADPNIPDNLGVTPLMQSVKSNDEKLVMALVMSSTPVNYNAKDEEGKTVIHHIVNPLPIGSYENAKLLYKIAKLGADINISDNAKNPPLYYAMLQDSGKMKNILSKLGAKPLLKKPQREMSIILTSSWEKSDIDVEEDLENFVSQLGTFTTTKVAPNVDDIISSDLPHTEVFCKDDLYYDVLLTKTDVKYGSHGVNNFYVMQIVHEKVKDLYILFNRWGRMGEEGQYQRTPFSSSDLAVKEFNKVFKSKTANVWSKKLNFDKKPKKWRLVNIDRNRKDYSNLELKPWNLSSSPDSELPSNLQKTIETIINIDLFKNSLKKSGLDTDLFPLSQIQQSTLDEASNILSKITDNLKRIEEEKSKAAVDTNYDQLQLWNEEIAELSNDFYELIPHANLSRTAVRTLDKEQLVQSKIEMINNLLDISVGRKIIMAASSRIKTLNPIDYTYKALDVLMEPLTENDTEFSAISRYTQNTKQSSLSKIRNIYRIQRKGEAERMLKWKEAPNHVLLWHGSGNENIVGILSEGLRVAPRGVKINGQQYGKGIYFADMFAKSVNYCDTHNEVAYLFLCEVVLGKIAFIGGKSKKDSPKDPFSEGFNSLKFIGNTGPDFKDSVVMPNGVKVPLGMTVTKGYARFSEYIVQDPSQIRLRYLVEISH
eukprot:TRINITY_DN6599_c0_g1_i3.p1 TRINITY_DN6599_c0_g1~~TRINITY_DN6599_c0_g1_i3.p1  ORF type:complete len:2657 (+),score=665.91 TRINITY_DN6599_c0_g1_i3:42-8012(+)